MNKLYHTLVLFFTITLAIAQADTTKRDAILAAVDSLRSEVKKTYDDGSQERVYYYDSNNHFIRAINFSKDGQVSSIYYLEKGVKYEFLKFDLKTGKRNRHTYYHPNKRNAVDIFYDKFENVKSAYFYTPKGKDRFEVICDLVHGGFSKRFFDSDGDMMKRISQKNQVSNISYVYNEFPHGPVVSIDKKGNKKKKVLCAKEHLQSLMRDGKT